MAKIKIFTTPTCTYCNQAKEFFKEEGVKFEEVDVSVNKEAQKEMIEKSNQMGVPVIDIDGKIIIGFDRDELEDILEKRKADWSENKNWNVEDNGDLRSIDETKNPN